MPTINTNAKGHPGPLAEGQKHLAALLLLLGYRFSLSLALLAVSLSGLGLGLLAGQSPTLFRFTVYGYGLITLLSGLALLLRCCRGEIQAQGMFLVDAVLISVLMYAGSGVASGLGGLLAVSIALTSLVLPGRLVLFLAAFATFSIFTQQIYIASSSNISAGSFTHAGLLGGAYFAIAILAASLTRRLGESEQLAQRQALDLADLARLNQLIIQEMSTGALVTNAQGLIIYINEAALKLIGCNSEQQPVDLHQCQPELERCRQRWLAGGMQSRSYTLYSDQAQLRATFHPSGVEGQGSLILLEDASEAMRQAQQIKLASLGRLTASIAHQIRNPLSSISHASQLLEESTKFDAGDLRLTSIIRNNCKRVNDIIESILQLSRRESPVKDLLSLDQWLPNFVAEYRQGVQNNHEQPELTLRGSSQQHKVLVDRVQLAQIIGNLCDNAMRHGKMDGQHVEIDLQLDCNPFDQVMLDLCDHGKGVSDEARERLFEPFFTTRSDGTGLGLYIAKELCEANQIQLSLLPSAQGAHFRLLFQSEKT